MAYKVEWLDDEYGRALVTRSFFGLFKRQAIVVPRFRDHKSDPLSSRFWNYESGRKCEYGINRLMRRATQWSMFGAAGAAGAADWSPIMRLPRARLLRG